VSCTTNFRTTSKSENRMQNSDGMQCILKMHVVSMTPHARCMRYQWHRMHDRRTIRTALAAFKGNIYQKHMFPNCPTPPLKKYINLKGLPKKNYVHAVSLTHTLSLIGVLFDEKNRGSKISWHCPFKLANENKYTFHL
jgi:hypothetical protein